MRYLGVVDDEIVIPDALDLQLLASEVTEAVGFGSEPADEYAAFLGHVVLLRHPLCSMVIPLDMVSHVTRPVQRRRNDHAHLPQETPVSPRCCVEEYVPRL